MPVTILVVLGLVVGGVVAITSGGSSHKKSNAGEIFLQPAGQPGPDPFGPSAATPLTQAQLGRVTKARTAGASTPSTNGPLTITTTSGATPALYGGSNQLAVCDKSAMVAFLQANPGKAAAWAGVQGIPVANLAAYITRLTPVILRSDTRVTNHGYANGSATAFQAILQAGTAVLVDEFGVPRARCACGNPLAPPVAVPTTPSYQGQPWPGFSPANVTVINQSTTVINVINVIDIQTGKPLGIPVGRTPPPTTTSPTPSAPPVSSTPQPVPSSPPATPSAVAATGWRLKTVKPVTVLGQPDFAVSQQWTSTGGGLNLTLHDDGTLCGGSGGSETLNYSWSFGRNITDLADGDTFLATLNAGKVSASGTCNGGLAARSGATLGGIAGGSLPLSSFDQPAQPDRIAGFIANVTANVQPGSPQTGSSTLTVANSAPDPTKPECGFVVTISGPGVEFFVLYVYEQVG